MARRKPPLHAVHEAAGASFVDFGGWDMPVEFDSIRTEHTAVRESAGIFDVSHMGEIEVAGPDATALMQRLTTNDVAALDPGEAQYTAVTDEDGVMLDDVVVYRRFEDSPAYLFVPNAGHDVDAHDRWIDYRDATDLDATVGNVTDEWAMFAIQGPEAPDLVAESTAPASGTPGVDDVRSLSRFEFAHARIDGVECLVARTGYTGEDGFEVLCPVDDAETVWNALDCRPCGLGARDTLRIEMGFLLSGQDFDPDEEPRTPFEAGIGFAVDLDVDFRGRDALAAQLDAGIDERFTGVVMSERGVPREGYPVTDTAGATIGHLTSGTMSPTLGEPIGLGYLDADAAEDGTEVGVVVRGETKRARVQSPPFLDR
ncbi:glycine cleavage system aminomethyltransferase GcvT [Halopenitus sp. H-Gu1]|uniref:glycine cleavage system aminomethyltransferase GcvT n=1 Tax=Halopenitus sp. H-Gu1 TaxID=3242697 RepID=UPI00359D4D7B